METIQGLTCITWAFKYIDDGSKKAQTNRRNMKDAVGRQHLETPMLDTKTVTKGRTEYCDILLISSDIKRYEEQTVKMYPEPNFTKSVRHWKGESKTYQL